MTHIRSGVSETLNAILFGLQRAQNRRITYVAMSEALGISQRAFSEWMRGAREPAAMEALLRMLAMLPKEDVMHVLDVWRTQSATSKNSQLKAEPMKLQPKKNAPSTRKTIQKTTARGTKK
jgi:predicted XRE-type DNA-binding protein